MMVIFVSQCEKNALKKTRRVLDAFADRIGDNTWQTIITQEGLDTVQKMLRKTASRSTAVSCHWIRSRSRSQFLWVVGNKNKFNAEGVVAVNWTEKDLLNHHFENDWKYLPLIKALAGLSALLHDWGKASQLFQNKINPDVKTKHKGDPIRHEWISCVIFSRFIRAQHDVTSDITWLKSIINGDLQEDKLLNDDIQKNNILADLPNAASLIMWLIVSHHRLPLPIDQQANNLKDQTNLSFQQLLGRIQQSWGYENRYEDYEALKAQCFQFPNGLLTNSSRWLTALKQQANNLHEQLPLLEDAMQGRDWHFVLHHARLCLMLGDHFYSSQPEVNPAWDATIGLFANTDPNTRQLKQKLDEHLVEVSNVAKNTAETLPYFESSPMESLKASVKLPKSKDKRFIWQDKAVEKILSWREETQDKYQGSFVVNMASTGTGKTIANAKIMQALSEDKKSLRFILALGLRTLTLQTGDEYKNKLGLTEQELAVLIGSKVVLELHELGKTVNDEQSSDKVVSGSESDHPLQDELDVLHWKGVLPEEELTTVITKDKDRQLLYAPVLACTIDHIMSATETKRGGRYILPCLRLMSSDLVIDEVDDFSNDDLIAIGRLIYLAGILGRKVMLSSATIPPDLALGLFNAYRQGWAIFASSRERHSNVNCVWVDEFKTSIASIETDTSGVNQYQEQHQMFIEKRAEKLNQELVKRRADIHQCLKDEVSGTALTTQYYQYIQQAILNKHQHNFTLAPNTDIRVSFGVVRMANISPCVELSKYLLECEWPEDIEIRCMPYHSQQVLLLRHAQEQHLDKVLKRKEAGNEPPEAFTDPVISNHLNNCKSKNLIFIVVATPVEEVGRDHDFDWAVIEPSSYRSIIQMAGRVRRHRQGAIEHPNMAVLQYNWKGFENKADIAFTKPGYESKRFKLSTHNLLELVDERQLFSSVNAIPRIQKKSMLDHTKRLDDLEHVVINYVLGNNEIHNQATQASDESKSIRSRRRKANVNKINWSEHLHGHLSDFWMLTALPQTFKPFRHSTPSTQIYLLVKERRIRFHIRNEHGEFNPIEKTLGIKHGSLTPNQQNRLWLERDYASLLDALIVEDERMKIKYGELNFLYQEGAEYEYNDQFGLVKKQKGEQNGRS